MNIENGSEVQFYPKHYKIPLGQPAVFKCITRHPVVWFHNSNMLDQEYFYEEKILLIKEVKRKDSGSFLCFTASDDDNFHFSDAGKIEITGYSCTMHEVYNHN